jgi:hypothetical protein
MMTDSMKMVAEISSLKAELAAAMEEAYGRILALKEDLATEVAKVDKLRALCAARPKAFLGLGANTAEMNQWYKQIDAAGRWEGAK